MNNFKSFKNVINYDHTKEDKYHKCAYILPNPFLLNKET